MEAGTSCGLLCHLVSEVCAQRKGEQLLKEELERFKTLLEQHLLYFKEAENASQSKTDTNTLKGFISRLSITLNVQESLAKNLLTNYLASEFRGTKSSLRSLMRNPNLIQPLLQDVTHFYHSERLALLQTLKILASQVFESLVQPLDEPYVAVMQTFLYSIKKTLKTNIVEALKKLILEEGKKEKLTKNSLSEMSEEALSLRVHFALREQSELLQLLLLLQQIEECDHNVRDLDEDRQQLLIQLLDLFEKHAYGRRQKHLVQYQHLPVKTDESLVESIGQLESLLITCLLDLANLTRNKDETCDHYLWSNLERPRAVQKKLLTLGSQSEHGPILLTWMLSNYLSGQAELEHSRDFGNSALRLRVIHFSLRTVSSTALNCCIQGIARGSSYILLTALMSSFEIEPMGIAVDVQHLTKSILNQKSIAEDFWRSKSLASHINNLLRNFPAISTSDLCDVLASLATAGPESADQAVFMMRDEPLVCFLENIGDIAEHSKLERISSRQVVLKDAIRKPFDFDSSIHVEANCLGDIVETQGFQCIRWQTVRNASLWKVMLNKVRSLAQKAALGAAQVEKSSIIETTAITQAFDAILKNASVLTEENLEEIFACVAILLEKIVRALSTPPMQLIANCISILTAKAARDPKGVMSVLLQLRLFPIESREENAIDAGLLGSILAEQECFLGEYSLTEAYLNLLETISKHKSNVGEPVMVASIKYITRNLLPSFRHWRYESLVGMEQLGQKLLSVLHSIVTGRGEKSMLKQEVCQELMESSANETLLGLVLTGDRNVQRMIECQSSWEWGQGTSLAHLIHLAMQLLRQLLTQNYVDVKKDHFKILFCSPSTDSSPNFMLIIAQYAYHTHVSKLGVSALELLTTLSQLFPLSLISCLGESGEAVKDILLFRLQSPIEPLKLKCAITELLTVALAEQPGFSELFLYDNQESEKPSRTVEAVLSSFDYDEEMDDSELQLAVVNFFLQLWLNDHKKCIFTLRNMASYWTTMTSSLFSCSDGRPKGRKSLVMAQTLKLVCLEVFSVEGKVAAPLKTRLDSLFDEKCETFRQWWQFVFDDYDLLMAWKAFLIVIVKDIPTLLTPAQCQFVATSLVKCIGERLENFSDNREEVQCLLALSEMCLILVRRWQTKCAENMRRWCEAHVSLLERLAPAFEALPNRTQQALLGVAITALKVSAFKLENEDQALAQWVEPAVGLVLKSLALTPKRSDEDNALTLSIHLLRTLVTRISDESLWFGVVHTSCLVQALVSKIHHCLKARTQPQVSRACLEVLDVLVNRSLSGCKALLSNDLERILWLPLAEMSEHLPSKTEWLPTYYFSITLNASLMRLAEYQALDNCITFVALLREPLSECLMAPRSTLQATHIDLALVTANLVAELMRFFKQWKLRHPSSEAHFFSQMCTLIHVCTCLLIRPTFLGMLVARSTETSSMEVDVNISNVLTKDDELHRIRRMSSSDQEVAATTPETTSIQNSLLDMIGAVVSMLINRSPDFVALINNDVIDLAEHPSLLAVAFASPAFEDQTEGCLVSYGTLVSVANLCIRTMTRNERSPSPATTRVSPASSSPRPKAKLDQMDRRRLLLVLEQTLVLLVSQAMLHLSDRSKDEREKHLLRRELGAEIGTIIETGKRYFYRALSRSPQSRGSAASPASAKGSHVPRVSKADEHFIKMVANVVLDVFK